MGFFKFLREILKIHLHDWSAWGSPVMNYHGNILQWRKCKTCGHLSWQYVPRLVAIDKIEESLKGIPDEEIG